MNADGYADILLSAPLNVITDRSKGRVYVYSGKDGTLLHRITGENVSQGLGLAVAGLGDIDQDGHADFVATDPLSLGARLYSGKTGAILYTLRGTGLGLTAASAGDVNQDGFEDLVIGDPDRDSVAKDSGSALLYSGRTGDFLYEFRGEAKNDRLGNRVAGAGDVNRDGFPDMIVGASSHSDLGFQDNGGAYVFAGNDLFLQTNQVTYAAGDTLTLTTRGGEPGFPVFLFLVAVNGRKVFEPLAQGILDSQGAWSFSLVLPPGLEGNVFHCRSFSSRPLPGAPPHPGAGRLDPRISWRQAIDSWDAPIDIPDLCDPNLGQDCNQNGILDSCDITSGVSQDTDGDGIPDECQLALAVPGDFLTLQEALDFAIAGAVITVADGVYQGAGNRDLDFRGKDLTLESQNGPWTTVLDLQGARGFLFQSGETQSAIVRGFALQNGSASRGGAVYCSTGSPTIEQCIFIGNVASERGGALYSFGSDVVLRNCLFVQNVASLENGGAIDFEGGIPTVRHCTFASNFAHPFSGRGGALYFNGSAATVEHCILWGDFAAQGPEIFLGPGTLVVNYSDVQSGWAGLQNLDLDPLFVDAPNLDYHLGPGSPCIDAGDPAFVPLPGETDLDGQPRLQGTAVDLGADEAVP